MSLRLLPALPLAAALGAAGTARAVELTDWLRLDGFGTLATYRADDPVAGVRSDQRTSQVTRRKWRWDGDSQLTTQLTVNPGKPLRGVVQVLAKDDVTDRYKPRIEWLYGSWDATSALNFKAGRVVAPVFMLSDTRNLAYSQVSARPNQSVYQINPITSIDGVYASWGTGLAAGELNIEAAAGKTDITVTAGSIDVKRTVSLAARYAIGAFTARVGYTSFKLDGTLPATQAALNTLGSGATACTNCNAVFAARLPFKDIKGHIATVALGYDDGSWVLSAEWAQRPANSALVPDSKGSFVQAGYRIGSFTPYAAVGKLRFTESPLGLTTAAGAPPAAAAANAAFDLFLQARNDRSSQLIGLRWDFRENFALKLQAEALKLTRPPYLGVDSVVSYPNVPPIGSYAGPAFDGRVKLLSVNLDFVF